MLNESRHISAGLSRREFVSVAGAATAGLVTGRSLFAQPARSLDQRSVLVETAHFQETGGWVLDNQFHNILGFSYLLAHGMGRPVENARSAVSFPQPGRYHVWALTKDWCPGSWDAPGRFRLRLNGNPLNTTYGTEPGWGWQRGGVVEIGEGQTEAQLELEDLTGFEGRCSAVYFSLSGVDVPPRNLKSMVRWRREKLGVPAEPRGMDRYDVVIVGGGLSGCAAALAAAEKNLKVALVHNRPVLGGNASAEIRVHTLGIVGKAGKLINQINTPHWRNGSPESAASDEKRMANMKKCGADLLLDHTMVDVVMRGKTIMAVEVEETSTGELKRLTAPTFIDCTGDGWLGYMAGAEWMYGRESRHDHGEGWDRHGDLWSPQQADNRVMGTSVLWETSKGDKRATFPEVPWAKPVAKNNVETRGEWQWEYSDNGLNQIGDAEQIRDHMFRAIYGTYANAIKRPQHANLVLDWVAFNGGKRESRRLVGDYVFTGADARDSKKFADAVVTERRDIDVHYQTKLKGGKLDFKSEAIFQKAKDHYYYIPFRSLYSKNIRNLMMAGRCFSCSHIGLGGPRVMNTCAQMGVATGYAAALCKAFGGRPRDIARKKMFELRKLCGYTR